MRWVSVPWGCGGARAACSDAQALHAPAPLPPRHSPRTAAACIVLRSSLKLPPPRSTHSAAVYLVQGLLGLSRLAVFTFLKDELGLAPASVALVTSAGYAPWVRARRSACAPGPARLRAALSFVSFLLPVWLPSRRAQQVLLQTACWARALTSLLGQRLPLQMIKPLYGFLSDAVPLFGYRRCSYLALCGLLGASF